MVGAKTKENPALSHEQVGNASGVPSEDTLGTYEEREFILLEEGTYEGVLEDVQLKTFEDEETGEIIERWRWLFSVEADDGQEVLVSGMTSTIISSRSKAGKWIEALLGKKLKHGQVIGKSDLIGKKAMLQIVQRTTSNGLTFNNVADVFPMPKKKSKA